jgi:hypothetical protein
MEIDVEEMASLYAGMNDSFLHSVTIMALQELHAREGMGGVLTKFAFIIACMIEGKEISLDAVMDILKETTEGAITVLGNDANFPRPRMN